MCFLKGKSNVPQNTTLDLECILWSLEEGHFYQGGEGMLKCQWNSDPRKLLRV